MRTCRLILAVTTAALFVAPVASSKTVPKGGPGADASGKASVVTPSGQVRIFAKPGRDSTVVRRVDEASGKTLRSLTLDGHRFGIPYVSYAPQTGGLTPDGRTLVLAEPYWYPPGQTESEFLVLDAQTLRMRTAIQLDGAFSFDAISPDARTLYLVQHLSSTDPTLYAVRAYDMKARRLVTAPVVDRSEPGERMAGYAQHRETDKDGTWAYTLYTRDGEAPFIHALNTREQRAVCIDLPLPGGLRPHLRTRLAMSPDGNVLYVVRGSTTLASVDTRSHAVTSR
jgi:DNA-binding beta-propeller fold protein YncE